MKLHFSDGMGVSVDPNLADDPDGDVRMPIHVDATTDDVMTEQQEAT